VSAAGDRNSRIFGGTDLKEIKMTALAAAQHAAIVQPERMTAEGTPIRYIHSTFAPQDGRCFCLFEGASVGDVKKLNDDAKIPYFRVVDALDLTPRSGRREWTVIVE
jgi:hypothetical protein